MLSISSKEEYWLERAAEGNLTLNESKSLSEELSLFSLGRIANRLTSVQAGNVVTYAVSYNINYSNYCAASCPICAFYVPIKLKGRTDRGYELTIDSIRSELEKARNEHATEIHIVGGFNPDLPMEYYEDVFRTVKEKLPDVTLKALTIPEIDFIARVTGNSIREVVERMKASGVDAHTGGGAEIFNEKVRKQITTEEKISGEKWLEDAKLIHSLGLPGNSTITYGHVEGWDDILDHMIRLRNNQIEQPGFLSFIPLKFSLENTPLEKMGKVRRPSDGAKDLKVIAMARLIMGSAIRNISVYWVGMGKLIAQEALNYGGNDLVGTAFSEKIYKATNRQEITTTEELSYLVREIGRIPAERDTFYNIIGYT